jgi:hypothetical protein
MAKRKKAAEPPRDDEAGTKTVRVPADLKRMVKWIIRIEGGKEGQLMDWAARDRLTARFAPYAAQVEREEKIEREQDDRLRQLKADRRPE